MIASGPGVIRMCALSRLGMPEQAGRSCVAKASRLPCLRGGKPDQVCQRFLLAAHHNDKVEQRSQCCYCFSEFDKQRPEVVGAVRVNGAIGMFFLYTSTLALSVRQERYEKGISELSRCATMLRCDRPECKVIRRGSRDNHGLGGDKTVR